MPSPQSTAQGRPLSDRTEAQKVCNNYLLGACEAGQYCDYDHGERLSPGEQLALKFVLWQGVAPSGRLADIATVSTFM